MCARSRWWKRELEDDGGGCCVCGAESAAQPYHEIVASGLPHGNGGGAVVCRRARVGKTLAEEPLLRRNGRGSSG